MPIRTYRIIRGPNTFRLMLEAARIIDRTAKGGDLSITLENVGDKKFDGKTFDIQMTEMTASSGGINFRGWLKVPQERDREIKGFYNTRPSRGETPGFDGGTSWVEWNETLSN